MEARSVVNTKEKVQLLSDHNVPAHLNIADKPPALGGTIKQMSPQAFIKESENGMKDWTETIQYPADYAPVSGSRQMSVGSFQRMLASIAKIDASLVIAYMNDQVKYGVFTLKDIPPNTWVVIYAGQYQSIKSEEDLLRFSGGYSFAIGAAFDKVPGIIDAELIGGKARYVQHAPSKTRKKEENKDTALGLNNYVFNENIDVKNVAYANLLCFPRIHKGKQFLAYKTGDEPIPANHGLFVDYEKVYWLGLESIPKLFFKQGNMLEEGSYRATLITIKLYASPAHQEHIVMTYTHNEWKKLFKEGDGHIYYEDQEAQQAIIVEEQTFDDALNGKFKDAPFMIIDRPAAIAPLSKVQKFGIFASKQNASICTELYWITNISGWKYNEEGKVAFLSCPDVDSIYKIRDLLRNKGFTVNTGSSIKGPTIHVKDPDLNKLKELSKEIEQERAVERKTRYKCKT